MKRSLFLTVLLGGLVMAIVPARTQTQSAPPARRLNVLMIAVDDMRPEAGCYGAPLIQTPSLDALARRGTVFLQAYCQQAVCSPSRTSLLTGRRPDTTKVYDLETHFRATIPGAVTLPQHFKNHGYHTQAFSKIFHGGLDDPPSWSAPHWTPKQPRYGKPETRADIQRRREEARAAGRLSLPAPPVRDPRTGGVTKLPLYIDNVRGPSWEDPDVADNALPDGETADKAIETLRPVKDKPFFLAVGFLNPHLPYAAPKKYYDLYPLEKIRLAPNRTAPPGAPEYALHESSDLHRYADIAKGPIPDDKARELVRGYYAAISYVDAQIGRVLAELERLGLSDNTIVVVWGDHGYHLGEHGVWTKMTNFELATRSPLIVSHPGQRRANARTRALVEFVDIYPTLSELAGLPLPAGLEGASFRPLLDDPQLAWKPAAFSQFPRPQWQTMGYTMRTARYRYTEWMHQATGALLAAELYDHREDPRENVNLAGESRRKALAARLSAQLRAGWRAAPPPARVATPKR